VVNSRRLITVNVPSFQRNSLRIDGTSYAHKSHSVSSQTLVPAHKRLLVAHMRKGCLAAEERSMLIILSAAVFCPIVSVTCLLGLVTSLPNLLSSNIFLVLVYQNEATGEFVLLRRVSKSLSPSSVERLGRKCTESVRFVNFMAQKPICRLISLSRRMRSSMAVKIAWSVSSTTSLPIWQEAATGTELA